MDLVAIIAVPIAGIVVLALVLWGMDAGGREVEASPAEPAPPSAVPGVATGHHRSSEPGGAQ